MLFPPQVRLRLAWVAFGVHVAANLAMLAWLVRGIPPGEISVRAAYIEAHPTQWAIGWSIWMLAAMSLLLLFLAFADTLPYKGWAIFGVMLAFGGATLDWGVLSVSAFLAPTWTSYDWFPVWDRLFMVMSTGVDHGLYTLGGIVLCGVASVTPRFPRWLAAFSAAAWGSAVGMSYAIFSGHDELIAPASAMTFPLFFAWILLLGYGWLQKE